MQNKLDSAGEVSDTGKPISGQAFGSCTMRPAFGLVTVTQHPHAIEPTGPARPR